MVPPSVKGGRHCFMTRKWLLDRTGVPGGLPSARLSLQPSALLQDAGALLPMFLYSFLLFCYFLCVRGPAGVTPGVGRCQGKPVSASQHHVALGAWGLEHVAWAMTLSLLLTYPSLSLLIHEVGIV